MKPSNQKPENNLSRNERIRMAIDSADPAVTAALLMRSMHKKEPLPIAVIAQQCTGTCFVSEYLPYLDVSEVGGVFYIDLPQFQAVHAAIFDKASKKDIQAVSKQFSSNDDREVRYSRHGVTIWRIRSKGYIGLQWHFRVQLNGIRGVFRLGYDRSKAHKMAREISQKAKAKVPLIELYREYNPQSSMVEKLEKDAHSSDSKVEVRDTPLAKAEKSEITIQEIVKAYREGALSPSIEYKPSTARVNINQLRKVMRLGLGMSFPKGTSIEQMDAKLFQLPISALTADMVVKFKDTMLGLGVDYDEIDEIERLNRSGSANSTLRQAKSLFSKQAREAYRRAKLSVPIPREFMDSGFLSVADYQYTLPPFDLIQKLSGKLAQLKESNIDQYLILMLGLFVGLRPGETKHLLKEKIQYSGYWKVVIDVTKYYKPKGYHERAIKIPSELGKHLLELCQGHDSQFVLSGNKTYRAKDLFDEINPDLRNNFFPDVKKPCYELRKLYASASNVALGIDITHNRMGHKDRSTTDKNYIDRDAPQELVDLFNTWAKQLFGGEAFIK